MQRGLRHGLPAAREQVAGHSSGEHRREAGPAAFARGLPADARRVHFVGVGGVGMSGVAEMMCGLGYEVSGSDLRASAATERLRARGVEVGTGHDPARVAGADAVVVSAAVPDDDPEVAAARRRGLPVVPRGVMLAGLAATRATVAVTGTHGKSTTSSMVAVMLAECGLDPAVLVGARVDAFGSNARIGNGPHFVVEADESEPSLLALRPRVAVITNLEPEHLDYYGTFDRLRDTLVGFANRTVESGAVVACSDDPGVAGLRDRIERRVVTYAMEDGSADVVGREAACGPDGSRCRVRFIRGGRRETAGLEVAVPGRHNLLNGLAAFAVGLELGLEPEAIGAGLRRFTGVGRRFELRGTAAGVRVVDDYAHHPTEIAAVLATARRQPHDRLVVIFEPHRYSRTARFLDRFAAVLSTADVVVLADIFAAGEPPLPGITTERLVRAVRRETDRPVHHVRGLDEVAPLVAGLARPGDLVLTLGAGPIGGVGSPVLEAIEAAAAGAEGE